MNEFEKELLKRMDKLISIMERQEAEGYGSEREMNPLEVFRELRKACNNTSCNICPAYNYCGNLYSAPSEWPDP